MGMDPSIAQPHHTIHLRGQRFAVGYNQGRAARITMGGEQAQNLRFGLRIDLGGRLVGQQQRRRVGQRHRQPRPRGLPTRKLWRMGMPALAETNLFQKSVSRRSSGLRARRMDSRMLFATDRCANRLPAWSSTPIDAARIADRSCSGRAQALAE